jgi:hypothetical protein
MYIIIYEYRDATHNKVHCGEYYTNSLVDVGAFYVMIKRLGGLCRCDISQ